MDQQSGEDTQLTPEQISEEFTKLQKRYFTYEEAGSDQGIVSYEGTISDFSKLQKQIISNSLFSANESLEEIQPENLKYLLLPFYMGQVYGKIIKERLNKLEFSQVYLSEYLKLLNHYDLVPKDLKKYWKNLSDDGNYSITRDEKIQSFKDQKALENKLNNLEKLNDEKDAKETIFIQMKICMYKAIDTLRSNIQEIEILQYKEAIEKDPKLKAEHEKQMSKPLPKPKMVQIAKPDEKSTPYMFDSKQGKYICDGCVQPGLRQELQRQVFTPGTTMPTVTLDQLADLEIANMKKQEEAQKQAEIQKKKQEDEDSDRDSAADQKQEEKRYWDDWKDENEKGAGNRFGK
ncbi:protein phosphatase 2A regulatory B subunit, B56 family, putative [Ichthyophthirius multifiliis]|uniref:Protein phosphatase 2A regulatory B subunit, B56 family, putative n=1 Tax=Ichthyophthirius multifiliis TaxID=5932 RepID=G0QK42_ICHMU|nr:protein phosphatase 2A regulatory B subunit, B56 family, putative [Ichthyophthirius multifiliis]EGR34412.1 protein phosphatase 2A regulatory B subunit, B56 family, putative [Ichthyophthirius multifiliis]|eukprot:XP_004039716.1 protein phosphatase 2A regulatory B subunit, B56 family, putative [Ichthyophthirius multifiliis]